MDPRVLELISQCQTRPGATNESIQKLTTSLGITLPADYASLLAFSDGCEGFVGENYLSLSSAGGVQACGVYEDAPFYVFIASNGAGEGYAYDTRSADMPIVNVPFIGLDEAPRLVGRSVLEFLERLHARPLFED